MKKFTLSALALSAALAVSSFAMAADHDGPPPMGEHGMTRIDPALMAEGRIAFLRAVLQITPAQNAPFEKLATVIRKHAADHARMMGERHDEHEGGTAVSQLDRMATRLAQHEKHLAEVKSVLEPLYNVLTPAQKTTADALFTHGPMGHMGGMGGDHDEH